LLILSEQGALQEKVSDDPDHSQTRMANHTPPGFKLSTLKAAKKNEPASDPKMWVIHVGCGDFCGDV